VRAQRRTDPVPLPNLCVLALSRASLVPCRYGFIRKVAVTAPTGIASINVDGITIHSATGTTHTARS
jgi:hypothetical protein